MIIARQSTARTVTVGPILDADGVAVTDAVVGDLKIAKNGAAPAALNGSATLTHRNTGHYSLALTTSDLDTVGSAEIVIDDTTNAMPVKEITVIEEAVYDVTFAASAGALATAAALATVDSNVDAILEDTATTIPATLATIAGYIDTEIAAIKAVTDNIPDSGALTTIATAINTIDGIVDSILVDTDATIPGLIATAQADLDTITGADGTTLSTSSVAAVNATVDTALVDYDAPTKAELDALIGTPANLGGGATVADNLSDIAGATFDTSTDSNEAIRNRGDAAWTTGAGGSPPQLLQSTTIATLASQTSFTLTAGSADDDAYNGAIVIVTDSATSTQKAVGSVSDYTGSTKTVTLLSDPGIFTMAVGDTIDVLAAISNAPTAAAIRAEIDSNSTQLAAIVEDTGTTIPAQISGLNNISVAQVTTEISTALGTVWGPHTAADCLTATGFATSAALATVDTVVDGIKAVTDLIPDAGAMSSIATAASIAALNDIAATDIVSGGAITTSGGAVSNVTTVASVTNSVTVGAHTQGALAEFITDDTGETTAAAGSVAKISQGSAGGNVTVGGFTQAALAEMVTDDTGETSATAGSVAAIAQGSGGGSTVVIPVGTVALDRTDSGTIQTYVGETTSVSITVLDSSGAAVDVSGETLEVILERDTGEDLAVVANESITVGGGSNNVATFSLPAAVTAREWSARYALRKADGDFYVYAEGDVIVHYAPVAD